jgi:hypothetical protein
VLAHDRFLWSDTSDDVRFGSCHEFDYLDPAGHHGVISAKPRGIALLLWWRDKHHKGKNFLGLALFTRSEAENTPDKRISSALCFLIVLFNDPALKACDQF